VRGARRGRWWLWGGLALLVVLLAVIAAIVVPILTHESAGVSHQQDTGEEWATSVSAVGDDGRTRTVTLRAESGGEVDPAALAVGDRVVVHGTGFDPARGIYVAVCVVPASPEEKPGPCVGGAPQQSQDPEEHAGEIQWAPSTWVNDDWAWRLFGARSYDDGAGSFTAYLELADPAEVDCATQQCAIVTRNDHTAAEDRVQDVYLPIRIQS